mmetsp:Transcript_48636/g.115784  ORF Transcript_48636/g.115784 Transcript_48636/m.115784 type:complete len:260 (-) Transcript_48636:81-860(-)
MHHVLLLQLHPDLRTPHGPGGAQEHGDALGGVVDEGLQTGQVHRGRAHQLLLAHAPELDAHLQRSVPRGIGPGDVLQGHVGPHEAHRVHVSRLEGQMQRGQTIAGAFGEVRPALAQQLQRAAPATPALAVHRHMQHALAAVTALLHCAVNVCPVFQQQGNHGVKATAGRQVDGLPRAHEAPPTLTAQKGIGLVHVLAVQLLKHLLLLVLQDVHVEHRAAAILVVELKVLRAIRVEAASAIIAVQQLARFRHEFHVKAIV